MCAKRIRRLSPLERIERGLVGAARRHARRALGSYTSDDREVVELAALAVGMAIELLAKVVLFRVSPLLIASQHADLDTKFHLAGRPELASTPLSAIQTLSADQALTMAKRLIPSLRWGRDDERVILKVRNAAAHLAWIDQAELERAILIMVRVSEDLLPESGMNRADFWGENLISAADVHLDEAAAEVARRTDAKIAGAREFLAHLTIGLSDAEKPALFAALSARRLDLVDHDEPHNCPACGNKGWLACTVERGDLEWDYDGHDPYPSVSRTAYPYAFYCLVCNLSIDDQDELTHLHLADEIELDPDDDPWEAHEPDEDQYREL